MEWISIKDKLPDQDHEVLVIFEDMYYLAEWSKESGWRDTMDYKEVTVSHWMELPDEPNEY